MQNALCYSGRLAFQSVEFHHARLCVLLYLRCLVSFFTRPVFTAAWWWRLRRYSLTTFACSSGRTSIALQASIAAQAPTERPPSRCECVPCRNANR